MNDPRPPDTSGAVEAPAGASVRGPWLLVGLLAIVAAAGWWLMLGRLTAVHPDPWPLWVLALFFFVASYLEVDLSSAGAQSMSFAMTDAAFVAALLLGEPLAVALGPLAAGLANVLWRRPPLVKLLFNVTQESVGALAGTLVFHVIRDDRLLSGRTGFAAVIGGLVMGLFSQAAVSVVTRVASGSRRQTPFRSLLLSSVGSLGNGTVALQAVFLGAVSPWLAAVPAVLVAVLYFGYRGVSHQQQVTDRSDLLYRATAALHEQPNMDDGLISVLAELRTALRAQWARIVLFTPEGAVTCAVDADDFEPAPMTAALPSQESAARRLAAELSAVSMFRATSADVVSGPISVFTRGDTLVAPLTRGGQQAGVVMVDARSGSADRLKQADVEMVEMMSKQICVALEKGALERSLHQLVELERELTKQAHYDGVTALANRNFLMNDLGRLVNEPTTIGHAVLLVDLDDFKMVNDSLGHVAGDELLKIVAQRLVGCVGDQGVVGRLGGDEFAVLARDITEDAAERLAERIITAISTVVHLEGREVSVGATIGIRRTLGDPDQPADLLRDADLALYNAKGLGKGRLARYEASMHEQAQERLELTSALANAITRDEFVLVYQPIVDLRSGQVVAAEALVRWMHPVRGELAPGVFLTLTEESGLIVELGWVVLRQALRQLAEWEAQLGSTDFYLSVNVSARQLKEPEFAAGVLELLTAYGVPGHRLVLEITESVFIDDPIQTQGVLDRIATAGVRFGLDDFGTGYSSLSQLQQLPLYLVKVDRSFVSRLGGKRDGRVLVRAIIQLANALRLQVVAEGIETAEERDELVGLGCPRGQGWLLGRPHPAALLGAQLADQAAAVAS